MKSSLDNDGRNSGTETADDIWSDLLVHSFLNKYIK